MRGQWGDQEVQTICFERPKTINRSHLILWHEEYDKLRAIYHPEKPLHASERHSLLAIIRPVSYTHLGFAFAAPNDRAAALSAILTALVRPSLRTAPMHVVSAPLKGSGKTLLAEIVALIATGKGATIMVFTADPEEQRKRLLTVLMSGDQVIVLDNIEGVLSGDALCTACLLYTSRCV